MASPIARRLRANLTDAETRLWARLRYKQIANHRFRRQVPIGPYIVDFFCPAAKLVIEVDGGQHAERVAQDVARTIWLAHRGYNVLRFWNNDIFDDLDGVLEKITDALLASEAVTPHPIPPPQGGRE